MSQRTLGQAIGRTDQSVASWEKSGHIPRFADDMIRFIYAKHADGDERVKNIVQAINEADRDIYIVMRGSKSGWRGSESTQRPTQEVDVDSDAIPA